MFDLGQLLQLTIDSSMQAQTNQEKLERLQEKKAKHLQEYRREARIFQNQHRQRVRELQKQANQKKKELEAELMISLRRAKEQLEYKTKKQLDFYQMKKHKMQSENTAILSQIDFQKFLIKNKILQEEAGQRSIRQQRPQRKKERAKSERKDYDPALQYNKSAALFKQKGLNSNMKTLPINRIESQKRKSDNSSLSVLKKLSEQAQENCYNIQSNLKVLKERIKRMRKQL